MTLLGILLRCCCLDVEEESTEAKGIGCCARPLALFYFAWFIAGNVWVFGQWTSVEFKDEESEHYCDIAAYMFSFVLLILSWVAAPIICCCFCTIGGLGVAMYGVKE